ncbi:MAG: DUF5049 domain-containing protein [Tumebacillaceae bacterium]
MLPKVDVPHLVFAGIASIREADVNMLDIAQVLDACKKLHDQATVNWISNNKETYLQGVQRGFNAKRSRTVLLRTAI